MVRKHFCVILVKRVEEFQILYLVTGHFVPRSFRKSFRTILVISYRLLFSIWSFRTQFGHFVPISYPVWSFRTYFYHFLENCFGHFVPIFYCFVPKSFRTRSHFVPILVISYTGHFVPTSKLGTNWLVYEMTFFFVVIPSSRLATKWLWYETTFFFAVAMYGGSVYGSLGARWKRRTTFW